MGIGQGKGISYQTVAEKSTLSEVSSELFEMGIEGASYQTVAEKSTGWNIKITIWNGDRKGKGTSYQTVAENQHWL